MLELFSPETTLVVGLDLTDDEKSLIDTAVTMAQRTGARLILVHAAPPFRSYSLAGEGFTLPYEELERETYDNDLKLAEAKIEAIRENMPSDVVVETEVFRDFPEDALESVAQESHAQMILCGYRIEKHQTLLRGMSTALSLMRHASIPLMTVPIGTRIDFTDDKHICLVADNLKSEGFYALKAAMGFCKSIDTQELVHLHVNPMSFREIHGMVSKIKVAMLEGRFPSDPDFSSDLYIERLNSELLMRLRQRLHEADPEFAQGTNYRAVVKFGQPAEVLHRTVEETHASILVFGKHHFFRPKGFSLGKVPYQAMVERNVATLVVPDPSYAGSAL